MLALALTIAMTQGPTHLALAPWSGKDLPTATAAAAKYRLTVVGTPGTTVHLKATGVAKGWIAAFCNTRVCSPDSVDEAIPSSGTAMLQFELIREEPSAPARTSAKIVSDDGGEVIVP
jgi:hypothetical protein